MIGSLSLIRRFAIPALLAACAASAQTLDVYNIDVEGGKATLYVSPSGQSMLVDAGYGGNNGRDAERIVAVAKAAGLKRIDWLVVTHYHQDHAGGVEPLAARFPIGTFVDHGPSSDLGKNIEPAYSSYQREAKKHRHITAKPGETIPIAGIEVRIATADGKAVAKPLPGGGQSNASCAKYRAIETDTGENAHSIGMLITYGAFRLADLGDLHWNQEHDLACPVNKVGPVDVYITTHHGTKTSGSPQMVWALHPKVAIMDNGAFKGGSQEAWQTIHDSPGLLDLWQLHYSPDRGERRNPPFDFIANVDEKCKGAWIKLSARADGTFMVENGRNGFKKGY
ncbi:MAG TPA: MBL fold metallo-hydrolase [Bryobacteraceae bacterium]